MGPAALGSCITSFGERQELARAGYERLTVVPSCDDIEIVSAMLFMSAFKLIIGDLFGAAAAAAAAIVMLVLMTSCYLKVRKN